MKQGKATSSTVGATKPTAVEHNVNVGAVSEIGQQVRHIGRASSVPLYEGRGLEAPMKATTTYTKGSQGKH